MNPEIYAKGEKIPTFWEHPLLISSIQSWGTQTYDVAFDPKTKDLLTVHGFDGEKTHSYFSFPSTRKHLLDEYLATFEIAEKSPMTGYVTIPRDCLVGVLIAAHKADKKYGTSYFKRALVPKAAVVLKKGKNVSENEMKEFCAKYLADYEIPKGIIFLDKLPTNPAGKVEKRIVREKYG